MPRKVKETVSVTPTPVPAADIARFDANQESLVASIKTLKEMGLPPRGKDATTIAAMRVYFPKYLAEFRIAKRTVRILLQMISHDSKGLTLKPSLRCLSIVPSVKQEKNVCQNYEPDALQRMRNVVCTVDENGNDRKGKHQWEDKKVVEFTDAECLALRAYYEKRADKEVYYCKYLRVLRFDEEQRDLASDLTKYDKNLKAASSFMARPTKETQLEWAVHEKRTVRTAQVCIQLSRYKDLVDFGYDMFKTDLYAPETEAMKKQATSTFKNATRRIRHLAYQGTGIQLMQFESMLKPWDTTSKKHAETETRVLLKMAPMAAAAAPAAPATPYLVPLCLRQSPYSL